MEGQEPNHEDTKTQISFVNICEVYLTGFLCVSVSSGLCEILGRVQVLTQETQACKQYNLASSEVGPNVKPTTCLDSHGKLFNSTKRISGFLNCHGEEFEHCLSCIRAKRREQELCLGITLTRLPQWNCNQIMEAELAGVVHTHYADGLWSQSFPS